MYIVHDACGIANISEPAGARKKGTGRFFVRKRWKRNPASREKTPRPLRFFNSRDVGQICNLPWQAGNLPHNTPIYWPAGFELSGPLRRGGGPSRTIRAEVSLARTNWFW